MFLINGKFTVRLGFKNRIRRIHKILPDYRGIRHFQHKGKIAVYRGCQTQPYCFRRYGKLLFDKRMVDLTRGN